MGNVRTKCSASYDRLSRLVGGCQFSNTSIDLTINAPAIFQQASWCLFFISWSLHRRSWYLGTPKYFRSTSTSMSVNSGSLYLAQAGLITVFVILTMSDAQCLTQYNHHVIVDMCFNLANLAIIEFPSSFSEIAAPRHHNLLSEIITYI